jgi:hypothetical protein
MPPWITGPQLPLPVWEVGIEFAVIFTVGICADADANIPAQATIAAADLSVVRYLNRIKAPSVSMYFFERNIFTSIFYRFFTNLSI